MSAPFIGKPPDRPLAPPPLPPPPSGQASNHTPSDMANLIAQAVVQALREVMPSKAEMADAIRRGTKEAILEADD